MDRLRNILVATDLSEASRAALAQGARLASANGATLHVLHVVGMDYAAELEQLMPDGVSGVSAQLHGEARDGIEAEIRSLGLEGAVRVEVVTGTPIREILEAAKRSRADLLVIGATGESGRRGVGTVAVRCVRKAPTKVLLVPEGFTGSLTKIVACLDFSSLSPVVVEQAKRVAQIDDGSVTAIHVYQMPWDRSRWGAPSPDAGRMEDEFRALLDRRFRTEFGAEATGSPMDFVLIKHSVYGEGIVEYARQHGAHLVVTGTTGRSALGYVLLGTTAEKVIRAVGCAVLAVKQPGFSIGVPDDAEDADS